MEVSHTLDGYWVISGYLSETPSESAQAMMRLVKEQFIKANPLLDPAKVVTVYGKFNPTLYQADKYQSNDESNDGLVRVIANGKTTYIHVT
ncbi:hypothetical protein [Lactiplantibacillus plantarum]|uniref:hypothetical protein n=1 Tax=Lactiplantibacillus plantarum TaxID=1590 RepID=UPI0020A4EF8C|nr:hypothetical protein [Lactiplantibacillus plantarum]UTD42277.1 hypothetical protein H5V40_15620 [Lactiplantibacillus plantarum]